MDSPQLKTIFGEALARQGGLERTAYLDEVCRGDAGLRAQVETLLSDHERIGRFLGTATGAFQPAGPEDPTTGDATRAETPDMCGPAGPGPGADGLGAIIGPYKLLQTLGEGGMGTVYMAEQTHPVRRKVALKVIKAGMDSRQVVARFEAERQALAMMDHVNIARVLDAGATESGRPYFVMELVHGVPITKYCDDNRLTPRQRLELFVPVCQAVQHAHQKGIIHRDIKPSNVMVTLYDGKPVPKVIDFGVAKATEQNLTERTLFTQYGTLVGTLEYMSPEQAEMSALGVDTRSDVYSLGVLLYELLTGSTPLTHQTMKQAAFGEILRMIKEEEPPRPSTRLSDSGEALASISARRHIEPARLARLVRGELDWIVMRSLEKDRSRRYETANGLASDVRRYLDDEAVEACPPSARYRFRKFARRNKRALVTAALFGVMLLASVGAITGTLGWAVRDRGAREQELARKAERDLALTEQYVRQAVGRAARTRGELLAVLTKPGGVQDLLNQPARWDYLIRSARSELAQARQSTARAGGGLSAGSTQELHKLEERLSDDESDRLVALRLEKIRLDRATWVEGKFDELKAAAEYPEAFAGFAVLKEDAETVAARLRSSPIKEQLVAGLDDWSLVAAMVRDEALTERLLAVARRAAPDPAWADRLRQLKGWRDQEALGKLVREAPADRLSPQMLALVGRLLSPKNAVREAWLRGAQARYPADFWLSFLLAEAISKSDPLEASGFYRVALAVRPASTAAYNNLGVILSDQKKLPEAVAAFRKAIEIDPRFAFGYTGLGRALRDRTNPDEAIAAFRKAIEIDPKSTFAYTCLGVALRDKKQPDEAVAAYRRAIELDPNYAVAYHWLGVALRDKKQPDEAVAAYRRAIELDPSMTETHNHLGITLRDQKKLPEAVAAFRKLIEIDPKLAHAYNNLGLTLSDQEKLPEAAAAYRKAIEIDPNYVRAFYNLGDALRAQKKPDEAAAAFRRAIEIDPRNVKAYSRLGALLCDDLHDQDGAIAAFREAARLAPENGEVKRLLDVVLHNKAGIDESIAHYRKVLELNPKSSSTLRGLGDALQYKGDLEGAVAAYRRAIEIDPKGAPSYACLGHVLERKKDFDGAIDAYGKAVELDPQSVRNYNSLAWPLVGSTGPDLRHRARAVALARRAVELAPDDVNNWRTLGWAHYRSGDHKAAIAALDKVRELGSAGSGYEWFFLAMAHWHLGQKDEAHVWCDKAIEWLGKNQPEIEALRGLRAEAEELMKVEP